MLEYLNDQVEGLKEENAKLKRLLAGACGIIEDEWGWLQPEELEQWYKEEQSE